jgi:hypothetical protein
MRSGRHRHAHRHPTFLLLVLAISLLTRDRPSGPRARDRVIRNLRGPGCSLIALSLAMHGALLECDLPISSFLGLAGEADPIACAQSLAATAGIHRWTMGFRVRLRARHGVGFIASRIAAIPLMPGIA